MIRKDPEVLLKFSHSFINSLFFVAPQINIKELSTVQVLYEVNIKGKYKNRDNTYISSTSMYYV